MATLSLYLMAGLALHVAALLQVAAERGTLLLLAGFALTGAVGRTLVGASPFVAAGAVTQVLGYLLLVGFAHRLWRHRRAWGRPVRGVLPWLVGGACAIPAIFLSLALAEGHVAAGLLAALPVFGSTLAGASLLAFSGGYSAAGIPQLAFLTFGGGLILHGLTLPLDAAPELGAAAIAVPDLALLVAALSGSWMLWRYGASLRDGLRQAVAQGARYARAYTDLLERLDIGLLGVDDTGRVQRASPLAEHLLGDTSLTGRQLAELLPTPSGHEEHDEPATSLEWQTRALAGPAGGCAELVALRHGQFDAGELVAALVEAMPEPALFVDSLGRVQAASPAYVRDSGLTLEELLHRPPELLRSAEEPKLWAELLRAAEPAGRWEGDVWRRDRSGALVPQWLNLSAVHAPNGKRQGWLAVLSGVGAGQDFQEHLRYLAYFDGLTGLPNRELFSDHLKLALVQARREGQLVALMFLDLDRFKNINDTLGHNIGDQVLRAIATRLRRSVREGDTIARLGGDEFTVILPALGSAADASAVADKILRAFAEPLRLSDQEFHITASIGISLAPHDGEDMETVIKNADTAMYRAKELGRNNFQFYTADMSARFHHWVALENELRQALNSGEGLAVAYQPQLDIRTGRVVGVEALVRWRHPRLGELAPGAFIPIAEESGLIEQVGEWVLRTACRDARRWVDAGHHGFRVAVNLSAHQLGHRDLQARVERILAETGLEPRYLELELTETVLMSDIEQTHAMLHSLNRMGIELAIDDFGTGYSSLGYLRQFTIDKLKIDQSFVRDVPEDPNDATIATSIIAMAHKLKLKVIAEGVEKQTQLDFLRRYGCDQIQGFLYAPPGSAEQILHHLNRPVRLH